MTGDDAKPGKPPGEPPIYMTVNEVVDFLKVAKSTLYEWSSRGLLDQCKRKVGRQIRINRECLLRLIDRGGLDTSV
ncbi:MAG: helix-turn-helix domain-containing protein [Gemmatales bacterium]